MRHDEFTRERVEIDAAEYRAISARRNDGSLPGRLFLVDVREDSEWAAGHAQGALHLPLSRMEREWEEHGFQPADTLVFYCAAGMRSLDAAYFFAVLKGFDNVRSVAGGLGALDLPLSSG